MGVIFVKKQVVVVAALSAIFSLTVVAPTFAGPKKPPAKQNLTKQSAVKSSPLVAGCRATTAVGHAPLKLPIPAVNKPHVNKVFTLKTNCGDIVIDADGVKAPLTVIALSYLAQNGYYDQSLCHRLVTSGIFVLQCGDPTASGQGGPKFYIPNENFPVQSANSYPAGTVAMAKGQDLPDGTPTNGSQFFIVYQDNSGLAANYTIFGHVTKGLDIVKAIAAAGNSADGVSPAQPVAIEKFEVK
jgi:peptidyl-prolyl cis-trans isomerase B (cyclophilin B)